MSPISMTYKMSPITLVRYAPTTMDFNKVGTQQ